MPEVHPPYLPVEKPKEYCLVLDLDETLIHYIDFDQSNNDPSRLKKNPANHDGGLTSRTDLTKNEDEYGGHFLIRPGARDFLKKMAAQYELVIFTAAMQDYADWVLDILDEEKLISHRLYR